MEFRVAHIRKRGNSLGVNLPGEVIRELGVREHDAVSIRVENGVLLLAKLAVEELEAALREQAEGKTNP